AWPGAHGAAILLGSGTFGPRLSPDGRPHPLEELASGPAMVAAYRALGGRARRAQEVLDLYESDPLAAQAVVQAGSAAGQCCALPASVRYPPALFSGGGLGRGYGPYWQGRAPAARAQTWPDASRRTPLLRSSLGPDAAAIGAALRADADPG